MEHSCEVSGCDRRLHARGLCVTHWRRLKQFGDPLAELPPRKPKDRRCDIEGCERPHEASGYCSMHYKRFQAHGDTKPRKPGKPYMGRSEDVVREVLLANRIITDAGCWEWTRSMGRAGYGMVSLRGKQMGTHRAAYLLFVGAIPEGLYVCHRCDNRPCFNPEHLFLGTAADNHADMVNKGRSRTGFTEEAIERRRKIIVCGERIGTSKLNAAEVRAIRVDPGTRREVAARYGVSPALIAAIRQRRLWKHVA